MHQPKNIMLTRERKSQLRRQLLARRLKLDAAQRRSADAAIVKTAIELVQAQNAQKVSGFLAFRGEPDLAPALTGFDADGRQVYVPVIKGRDMRFVRWQADAETRTNHFGIAEPVNADELAPQQLDLVLMPLVGFSSGGGRLGMGAGYYDRAFAFCRHETTRPRLVGVAYRLQQVDSLPLDEWDVPLDDVITEDGLTR